jgi:hypothetical protein
MATKRDIRTFEDDDETSAWAHSTRDERLWKYLRPCDVGTSQMPMGDKFDVLGLVQLPKSMLVDTDIPVNDVTIPKAVVTDNDIDRGDVYEAFSRTKDVTIRGVFVNGEPVWGTAQYHNGMSYTGMFAGGVPHGFGEKRSGASVYKGRFHKGERHGRGMQFDARNFRLYAGMFDNDMPHGKSLCIVFSWSKTQKRVLHTRSVLEFDHGVLITCEKTTKGGVYPLSGLENEEFLEMYRHGEKALEDFVARFRLKEVRAEEHLWQPVAVEYGSSHYGHVVA